MKGYGILDIKRVYETPLPTDGYRILVDRLWPRGVSKEKAALQDWMKDLSPSPALRTWFGHDPQKWSVFSAKHRKELEQATEAVNRLLQLLQEQEKVSLIYAAADQKHSHALVLQQFMVNLIKSRT